MIKEYGRERERERGVIEGLEEGRRKDRRKEKGMKRRNSARFGRKFEILCSFVQYITSETGDAILHTLRTISWPTPALSTRRAEPSCARCWL